jgi:hypothetical protein
MFGEHPKEAYNPVLHWFGQQYRDTVFCWSHYYPSWPGHLFKLGLINDPICERCQEVESATHILCDCEAVAQIRFRHLAQFFMEPSDYYDAPIDEVLHFI